VGEISKKRAAALVAVSVLLTSMAQLLFRLALKQTDTPLMEVFSASDTFAAPEALILLVGVSLYGASMLMWMFALTRFPVSLAYPILSLSYIIVYVAATQIPALGEAASMSKMIGVGLVVIGVSVMYLDERSDPQRERVTERGGN